MGQKPALHCASWVIKPLRSSNPLKVHAWCLKQGPQLLLRQRGATGPLRGMPWQRRGHRRADSLPGRSAGGPPQGPHRHGPSFPHHPMALIHPLLCALHSTAGSLALLCAHLLDSVWSYSMIPGRLQCSSACCRRGTFLSAQRRPGTCCLKAGRQGLPQGVHGGDVAQKRQCNGAIVHKLHEW